MKTSRGLFRIRMFEAGIVLLLVVGNLLVQARLERAGLDDRVVNRYSPTSTDSEDYVRRAHILSKGGSFARDFEEAFGDAYRPPAYPLFLSAFLPVSDAPLRAARMAQVLLSALMIALGWRTLRNLLGDAPRARGAALAGAALIALWVPLYYFSPILIAEGCSLFVLAALLHAMSLRTGDHGTPWIRLSFLLALLIYLKPNHILLLLPVAAFVWMREKSSPRRAAARTAACVLVTLALLAPWSIFLTRAQGKLMFLSTASGVNLYLGTGVVQFPGDANTLPYRFAKTAGLAKQDSLQRVDPKDPRALAAEETRLAAEAQALWQARPARMAAYGVLKALHGFGFSLRGARDLSLVLFLGISLVASARAWKSPAFRPWAVFFWGVLGATCLQMFVYLPNQRFKVVLFDLPALLMIVLGTVRLRRREEPAMPP